MPASPVLHATNTQSCGTVAYAALQHTEPRVRPVLAFSPVSIARNGEAQLLLQRQRHEAFVATLAHELRQPLSVIATAVEIVQLAPESEAARRAIKTLHRQTHQMHRMVDDLAEAVRWALGKMPLRLERFDLRTAIDDAVQDIAADAVARSHVLFLDAAAESLWVDADRQRLHQVLSNLLANAIKYTDAGGRITITSARRGATVTMSVADTGRGLEASALTHIFDLFSQVLPAEGAGLGIGLSVALNIVTRHYGRIEARSAGIGRGSEFVVTLPMAAPGERPESGATSATIVSDC